MLQKFYHAASAVENAVAPKPEKITWFEKQILKKDGARSYRLADEKRDAKLLGEISDIYQKFNVYRRPKVIVYEHETPNAANLVNGTFIISTSLLKILDERERKVVIAHEAAHHVQKKSVFALSILTSLTAAVGAAFGVSHFSRRGWLTLGNNRGWDPDRGVNAIYKPLATVAVFGFLQKGLQSLFQLPLMALSRWGEMDADKKAIRVTEDPDALVTGLKKIRYHVMHPTEPAIPPTDRILAEKPPQVPIKPEPPEEDISFNRKLAEAYHSHPTFTKRFKNIRETAQKEGIPVGMTY